MTIFAILSLLCAITVVIHDVAIAIDSGLTIRSTVLFLFRVNLVHVNFFVILISYVLTLETPP